MIKGLYAAASAMMANMELQKTIAHNASNLETVGFKQLLSSLDDYLETRVTFSPGNITKSNILTRVGNVGLGTTLGLEVTDFDAGGMKFTGNMFDFALSSDAFFRIQNEDGEERLTRDGRFIRDADNQLVTIDGYHVLDTNGQTITLPEGEISVSASGEFLSNGEIVGQMGLTSFENPVEELEREGNNLFVATDEATAVDGGEVEQGFLEMSNVNVSHLSTQMVIVSRSYEAAQKMVTQQDYLINKTITTLRA